MALDTPQKRFAMMNLACPWRPLTIPPTGSVTTADRQQFLYLSVAVAWAAAAAIPFTTARFLALGHMDPVTTTGHMDPLGIPGHLDPFAHVGEM